MGSCRADDTPDSFTGASAASDDLHCLAWWLQEVVRLRSSCLLWDGSHWGGVILREATLAVTGGPLRLQPFGFPAPRLF